MMKIKGIIFDLDGTLVSSNIDFPWLRQQCQCPDNMDLLTHIESLPARLRLNAEKIVFDHEMQEAAESIKLPNIDSVLDFCSRQNIPMGIVTRNVREAAAIKLSNNQIQISRVISRHDAAPKPNPEGLLMLAKEWGIAPQHILYVGDYLYDIQAANNAGMVSCLYSQNDLPDYHGQADVVIKDHLELSEMLIQYAG